jgi:LmbE family N-acetylglucosaminyl deacetylase
VNAGSEGTVSAAHRHMVTRRGQERVSHRDMETRGGEGGVAVAVSPHLDDAVFSVGGTLTALAAAGWRVRVVTCFTASVADPSPFALSTQLDKGLDADIDYMAVRRAEDTAAQHRLGTQPVHLPLPEAPHRGYTSAADLFAGRHDDDDVAGPLGEALAPYLRDAALVLAPQAIGDHVDHRVVVDVVAALLPEMDSANCYFWRDAPYVLRRPDAAPWRGVPVGTEHAVDVAAHLPRKADAARCYATQLGFQFGGDDRVAADLDALARAEAVRVGAAGPCEVLTGVGESPAAIEGLGLYPLSARQRSRSSTISARRAATR